MFIKFKSFLVKKDLFKYSKLLRMNKLYIQDDLTKEERMEKAALRDCMLSLKNKGIKASIKKGKISIGNQLLDVSQAQREFDIQNSLSISPREGREVDEGRENLTYHGKGSGKLVGEQWNKPKSPVVGVEGHLPDTPIRSTRNDVEVAIVEKDSENLIFRTPTSPSTPRGIKRKGEKIDKYFRPAKLQLNSSSNSADNKSKNNSCVNPISC